MRIRRKLARVRSITHPVLSQVKGLGVFDADYIKLLVINCRNQAVPVYSLAEKVWSLRQRHIDAPVNRWWNNASWFATVYIRWVALDPHYCLSGKDAAIQRLEAEDVPTYWGS